MTAVPTPRKNIDRYDDPVSTPRCLIMRAPSKRPGENAIYFVGGTSTLFPPFMADSWEQMPAMVQLAARRASTADSRSFHDGADELVGQVGVRPAVAGALDERGVLVLLVVDAVNGVRGDLLRQAVTRSREPPPAWRPRTRSTAPASPRQAAPTRRTASCRTRRSFPGTGGSCRTATGSPRRPGPSRAASSAPSRWRTGNRTSLAYSSRMVPEPKHTTDSTSPPARDISGLTAWVA